MNRLMAALGLSAAVLATNLLPSPRLLAQAVEPAQTQQSDKSAGFVHVYRRWLETRDPEEGIALAERALELEFVLKEWPLEASREGVRGILWFALGITYQARNEGAIADNCEKAIAAFEAALTSYTREAFPQEWAQTQSNLANAYTDRIRGVRADNIEKAIAAYEAALTHFTRSNSPQEWAQTYNNLANAYAERIQGVRAENIEKAIGAFEAALSVRTKLDLPQDWAQTQNNLAITYRNRIRGDRADNVEKAIAAFDAALTIYTREAFPQEWAQTQSNLANAYTDRIRGVRADNIEKAIAAYEAALTIRTRETFPEDWAQTQNNLAVTYRNRVRGVLADNLEKAIDAYQAALTVRTREAFPRAWALTLNNLAFALTERSRGVRNENLKKAISYLEAALTVFTPEVSPEDWAQSQNTLAFAYMGQIGGMRAENLEKARVACTAALTVFTREAFPKDWAENQYALGIVLADKGISGARAKNLEKAIAAFEGALTIFTRGTFPRQHMRTAVRLGATLIEVGEWHKAEQVYASARDAFLLLFGQGLEEAEARDLITMAGPLFAEAAYVVAQRGETEAALALAAEGRARLLAVALKLQTLDLLAPQRRRLDALRASIRTGERLVEAVKGTERTAAIDKLVALRNELLALVKDATEASGLESTLARARAIAGEGGVVVVPVLTKLGSKILIVTNGVHFASTSLHVDKTRPESLDLPELTTDRLDVLLRGERKDGKTKGWLGAYNINYLPQAELNKRWSEWQAAISDLGPELWRLFAGRLDAVLRERGIKPGARLVWLPTGALGILPLGLAQDPASGRRLADNFEIVYAPSLEALTAANIRTAKLATASLAAVINPTGDLSGTEKEGAIVASYFAKGRRNLIQRGAATPDAVLTALKGKTHWHFASHGTFSWEDARASALVMHNGARLSVGKLLETDGLGSPRLVVLSACETGLYDIERNPDEFVGLPGAFTALGAAGVLATLWPVDDTATALLIAKFYELHMGNAQLTPPAALSKAQSWLRRATKDDLHGYAKFASRQGRLQTRHLAEIERAINDDGLVGSRNRALVEGPAPEADPATVQKKRGEKQASRPFSHPYFWAGFIHTGL